MKLDKNFSTKYEIIDCYSYDLKDGELKPRVHIEIFHNGKRLYTIEASVDSAFITDTSRIVTIRNIDHE